jgi:hypothetical protein
VSNVAVVRRIRRVKSECFGGFTVLEVRSVAPGASFAWFVQFTLRSSLRIASGAATEHSSRAVKWRRGINQDFSFAPTISANHFKHHYAPTSY